MKYIYIFLICLVSGTTLKAQTTETWLFAGTLIEEDKGCNFKPYTKHEVLWVKSDDQSKLKLANMKNELKLKYKGHTPVTITYHVTLGKKQVIALVEKSIKCGGGKSKNQLLGSLGFYMGANHDSIIKQVERERISNKGIIGFKVVEIIDCDTKIAELKEKDKPLPGHHGLEVTFTQLKQPDNQIMLVATFSNARKDSSMLVEITPKGGLVMLEEVKPEETFTRSYNSDILEIRMKLRAKNSTEDPHAVYGKLKEVTKGVVRIENDLLQENWKDTGK